MRDPCERMPVGRVGIGECPANTLPAQSFDDVSVVKRVNAIIEFNKAVSGDLMIGDEDRQDEPEADQDVEPVI